MEDLWLNAQCEFTKWVVQQALLRESFVVVDVGAQGGTTPRWNPLGDYLILYGFDPIAEVISELKAANAGRSNYHFHNNAIGEIDGEQNFYFNRLNPTASSMYSQGDSRFGDQPSEEVRVVTVRRLDSLLADGTIQRADFLKVDVEGFEKNVFHGGPDFIAAGVLGVEVESNFNISPIYPKSHFVAVSDYLVGHGLIVADIGFNRVPRATFTQALQQSGIAPQDQCELGRPATLNLLFCRDPIHEGDHSESYCKLPAPLNVDQIIKTMMIYELYGLNDIALDIARRFRRILSPRLDVEQATRLLARADCRQDEAEKQLRKTEEALRETEVQLRGTEEKLRETEDKVSATEQRFSQTEEQLHAAERQLRAMKRSNSWRITAPLRKAARFLRRRLSN
jgi:FkbM family methyltransferase